VIAMESLTEVAGPSEAMRIPAALLTRITRQLARTRFPRPRVKGGLSGIGHALGS
jgi:hypothetical protein